MPEYDKLMEFSNLKTNNLFRIYSSFKSKSQTGYTLLKELLEYDPEKRISPDEALSHQFFKEIPIPKEK